MMAVDYFKDIAFLSDNDWLISAGPIDVANQLGESILAHTIRIVWMGEKLFDFDYSRQAKTLFIWEGVVHYLTAEAVDQTLEFVLRNSGSGSSIVFDYVYTSALTAAHKRGEIVRMQRAKRYTGEGLVFGIEEGQVEEFLRVRGYTQICNVTGQDLKRIYFTGVNRTRAIAPIYAIVHATVKG